MFSKKAARRSKKRRAERRSPLRRGEFESLESRCLLAGVTGDPIDMDAIERVAQTVWLEPGMSRADFVAHLQGQAGGQGAGSDGGSGEQSSAGRRAFQLLSEVEPNNSNNTGNLLPLGNGPGQDSSIDVLGSLTQNDVDTFLVDLKAGDILGASVDTATDVSIQRFDGTELQGAAFDNNSLVPLTSPLPRGGLASASYVITADGRYAVQVAVGTSPYRLTLRTFRPVLESEPVGTKQILFLDFDGATLDATPFGGPGVVNLSPMSTFLPGVNLGPADESRVIDAIVANFEENFQDIRDRGMAGDFRTTGTPGDFDIEILNSRDHADPWGLPNVSRIIIGGTQTELGVPTVGIAESVDVGNFDTTETGIVLLDELFAVTGGVSVNQYPLAGGATIFDVIGEAVGGIGVHEAGHFFGAWHQFRDNNVISLMDTGGNLDIVVGVGTDGIFGTADDIDVDLADDVYEPTELLRGLEEALKIIGQSLPTGKDGAVITGFKWHDLNGNGVRESGEPGLEDWLIYSDANGNAQHDPGEFSTLTDSNGFYTLIVSSGTHRISEELQPGWEQTFPLSNAGTHVVTVAGNSVLTNVNFGNRSIGAGIQGQKFHDLNADGIKQGNEPGLPGFYIYLDLNDNSRPDLNEPADITDALGNYELPVALAGTYTVRESVPVGWTQTFPLGDGSHTVSVLNNEVVSDIDFGNSGQLFDFGETPLSQNGARHGILAGFQLGDVLDGEGDATAGPDADNDGITISGNLFGGGTGSFTADVRLGGHSRGYLNAWVDFNNDGKYTADEQITRNARLGEGQHQLTFQVPVGAATGNLSSIFRYGWERDITAYGPALAGEVEEYELSIFGDNPRAIDDSFLDANGVDQDSSGNFLDVLANDFPSSRGPLRVQSVQDPTNLGGDAQVAPGGTGVLYTPRMNFFGTDTFTYTVTDGVTTDTATVTVTVRPTFSGPVAVDDSFFVSSNSSNQALRVQQNDLAGPNPPTGIAAIVSGPSNGTAFIDNNGTVADPSDDIIRYTPDANFNGNDVITYRIRDAQNQTSEAKATITVGDQASRATVSYTLRFTDANGTPITQIQTGERFFAEVYVQDNRPNPVPSPSNDRRGVFAAYTDVLYQTGQVSIDGSLIFDGAYQSVPSGNTFVPGLVDEAGAFRGNNTLPPPGTAPQLLVRIPFRANAVGDGIAEFFANPADQTRQGNTSGAHDTLLYEPTNDVPVSNIFYEADSLRILPGASPEGEFALHNWSNKFDVNNDGGITPFDVALLTNVLQNHGATSINALLGGGGGAEGEAGSRTAFRSPASAYYNVVPDNVIDVRDAAALISALLAASRAEGELAASEIPGTDLPTPQHTQPLARVAIPAVETSSQDTSSQAEPNAPTQPQANASSDRPAVVDLAITQRGGRWTSDLVDWTQFDSSESEDDFYADILDGWKQNEE